jgi:hypothetical protein
VPSCGPFDEAHADYGGGLLTDGFRRVGSATRGERIIMKPRHFYLALALVGLLLPNAVFLPWLMANGLRPDLFVRDLFANGVSSFFGLDVIVSALVVSGFIMIEGRRLKLAHRWMGIAAVCLVGVSLGLPLFLYQRQAHLDRATA